MSSQNPQQNQHTQLRLLTPTHTHTSLAAYNVLSRCLCTLSHSLSGSLSIRLSALSLSHSIMLCWLFMVFTFVLLCVFVVVALLRLLSPSCDSALSCSLSLLRSNSRFVFAVAGSAVVVVTAVFVSCTFNVVVAADVRLHSVLKK